MTRQEVRDCLHEGLSRCGFRRRGYEWVWESPQVRWRVFLDRLPFGNRVAVEVFGVLRDEGFMDGYHTLTGSSFPLRADAGALRLNTQESLHTLCFLDQGEMSDERRGQAFTHVGGALGEYLTGLSSTEALIESYALGHLRGRFSVNGLLRDMLNAELVRRDLPIPPDGLKPWKRPGSGQVKLPVILMPDGV